MGVGNYILKTIGFVFLFVGILFNPWTVEYFFSPDKQLDHWWIFATILLCDLFFLLLGYLFIFKIDDPLLFLKKNKLNVVVSITVFFVLLLLVEGAIRLCFFLPFCSIPGIDQHHYAHIQTTEYWVLRYLEQGEQGGVIGNGQHERDRFLGWDYKPNFDNGCHVTNEHRAKISKTPFDNTSLRILFYGDSFVESLSCSNVSLPAKLEKATRLDTYNFGVIGYGFDQVYLKMLLTQDQFDDSIVLIGLLAEDLDRSTLQMFLHPKPYFVYSEGLSTYYLGGVPIPSDPSVFVEQYGVPDVHVSSYLLERFLKYVPYTLRNDFFRQGTGFQYIGKESEIEGVEEEIRKVNTFIFNQILLFSEQKEFVLYFVLFYEPHELIQENWRHQFMKNLLDQHDILYFDTRDYLYAYAEEHGTPL